MEEVKIEELVLSNMYTIEAVVQLLIDKRILEKKEILERIKVLQQSNVRDSRKN